MTRLPAAAGGLLAAAATVLLRLSPPQADRQWMVALDLVAGVGFAAAGSVAFFSHDVRQVAVGAVERRRVLSVSGALLAVAGLLLTSALTLEAGFTGGGDLLGVLAVAVVLPLALLHVVARRRALKAQRALDAAVLAAGLACVAAVGLGSVRLGLTAGAAGAVALVCAGWLQFELTEGDQRRQVLWLILAAGIAAPTIAAVLVVADGSPVSATVIGVVCATLALQLPLSVAVALLAPRWLDVRALISWAVLIAVMFTLTVAVYSAGESLLRVALGHPPPLSVRAMLATALAAGFHPALVRVRAATDELLFGGRSDPVGTLTKLGTELTAGSEPAEWLETLRSALAVPGIVVRRKGEVVVASGVLDESHCTVTPLRAGTEHVGDLVVGIPRDQLGLASATRAVVELVAAPLAQALHAVRLTEQLQASRGRVVAALEEERRRVRRDLHDGLGPTLTGIAYSADAARNLLGLDASQAESILRNLRVDAGEAIAEVRRIVYGMRPRALDELGLIEAVRQRVLHLRAAEGRALPVLLVAPESLPALPAAVEVAAYRVAVEAVTNVARHAGGAPARLEFSMAGRCLRILVADEGVSDVPWRPGVGLTSMRERVEQIGGTLRLESGVSGATVTADFPLDVL